jgi:uncharacterized membrane protein
MWLESLVVYCYIVWYLLLSVHSLSAAYCFTCVGIVGCRLYPHALCTMNGMLSHSSDAASVRKPFVAASSVDVDGKLCRVAMFTTRRRAEPSAMRSRMPRYSTGTEKHESERSAECSQNSSPRLVQLQCVVFKVDAIQKATEVPLADFHCHQSQ